MFPIDNFKIYFPDKIPDRSVVKTVSLTRLII